MARAASNTQNDAVEYIEIDDVSSDHAQPEEVKEDGAKPTNEDDLESLPTQELYKMAERILHII